MSFVRTLSNTGSRPTLILDIGSGSVASAIAEIGHGDTPTTVIAARRESLKLTENSRPDPKTLLPGIAEAVKSALTSFSENHSKTLKKITEIHVVLHSPWATSSANGATRQFTTEQVIKDADISALAKEAVGSASPLPGNIFARAVVRTEVNGYPTTKPEGKRGMSLRVIALQSAAEESTISVIKDAVSAIVPGRETTFHAATRSFLTILQPLARSIPHYTFVDVTSELSEVFVVREGVLAGMHTADVGWRTLIRALADKYHTTPDDALSRLRMVREETGTGSSCEDVMASLGELATAIATSYGTAFTAVSTEERLPATMILSVPPDVAQWFTDFFARIDFSQFSVTEHPFSVQLLMARHLAERVQPAPGVTIDAGIASSAAFVHILTE